MPKESKFIPSTPEIKILETIFLLNEQSLFPLNEGVIKILKAVDDKEVYPYRNFSTYGSITSYSNKRISRHIMMLIRYKYLTKKYDLQTKEMYLAITNIGATFLFDYKKKHKKPFAKRKISTAPTIVKIEE